MWPVERRKTILNFLAEPFSASVPELCQYLSVSEMTIRRVLSELEKQGSVLHTYGGATVTESAFFQILFKAKLTQVVNKIEPRGAR